MEGTFDVEGASSCVLDDNGAFAEENGAYEEEYRKLTLQYLKRVDGRVAEIFCEIRAGSRRREKNESERVQLAEVYIESKGSNAVMIGRCCSGDYSSSTNGVYSRPLFCLAFLNNYALLGVGY